MTIITYGGAANAGNADRHAVRISRKKFRMAKSHSSDENDDDIVDQMRLSCSDQVDSGGRRSSAGDFSISLSYRKSTWVPVWLERLRLHIFLNLECANSSTCAKICSILMLLCIVASIMSFVLESMPHFQGGDRAHADLFFQIDLFFTILFTTEYLVRLWVCDIGGDTRWTFVLRPLNVCDLVAVLPFYIEAVMLLSPSVTTTDAGGLAPLDILSTLSGASCADILSLSTPSPSQGVGSQVFKVLRIVRLSRVFRLFKLSRLKKKFIKKIFGYFKALSLLATTFRLSAGPLLWAYAIFVLGTLFFAILMYFGEFLHCPTFTKDQESAFMSYSDTCHLASHFSNFTGYIAVHPEDSNRYEVLRPHTPTNLHEFCCQFWCQGKALREVVSGMCSLVLAPEGFEFAPICHSDLHIAHHTWASNWYLQGYVHEGSEPHIDDFWAQPLHSLQFQSIWQASWWALSTLVTVGYGDYVPRTLTGKVIATFAMMCSVLLLSLPIAILGSKFHEVYTLNQVENNLSDQGSTDVVQKAVTMEFDNLSSGRQSMFQSLKQSSAEVVDRFRRSLTYNIARVSAFSSPRSSQNSIPSSPQLRAISSSEDENSDADGNGIKSEPITDFPKPMSATSAENRPGEQDRSSRKSFGFRNIFSQKSISWDTEHPRKSYADTEVLGSVEVQELVHKIRGNINKLGQLRESSLVLTSERILNMTTIHQQLFIVFKSIADPIEFQHQAHTTAQKFFSLLRMEMQKLQSTYNGNELTHWSLGIFHHSSKWRQRALWIIQLRNFERVILALIIFHAILMATHSYIIPGLWWNKAKDNCEHIFLVVFTLEAILKIVSLGLYRHKHAYLRDRWNVFDFIVVVVGLVCYTFNVSTSIARVFRVFRPLRMMSRMPAMRRLTDAILSALPKLADVMFFRVFLTLLFSIIGLQLWAGKGHQRCRISSLPFHFDDMSDPSRIENYCQSGDFWCVNVSNHSDVVGINLPLGVSAAVLYNAFCSKFDQEFPNWPANGCVEDVERAGHWTVWPINPDDASFCGHRQCSELTTEPGSFLDRNPNLHTNLARLEASILGNDPNTFEEGQSMPTYCGLNYGFPDVTASDHLLVKSNAHLVDCLASNSSNNSSTLSDSDSTCASDVYAPATVMSTIRKDFVINSNHVQDADLILPDFNFGFTNFDNIGSGFLTMFQVITMEGWTDIALKKNFAKKLFGGTGAPYHHVLILS